MKKVIYTCITGGYDELLAPHCVKSDFDYICFADSDIKSGFWQIRPLPKETDDLSNIKKQRYVKINAHKVLPEYDFSIYFDGNLQIIGDIEEMVNQYQININNGYIFIPNHSDRDCIYEEKIACIKYKRDTEENMREQIEQYRREGMPEHYGMTENSVIFRFHNDPNCSKLMELWWKEFKEQKSNRDQLSLPYILWKNSSLKVNKIEPKLYDSKYFKRVRRH